MSREFGSKEDKSFWSDKPKQEKIHICGWNKICVRYNKDKCHVNCQDYYTVKK